jgi:hypothetical protein
MEKLRNRLVEGPSQQYEKVRYRQGNAQTEPSMASDLAATRVRKTVASLNLGEAVLTNK